MKIKCMDHFLLADNITTQMFEMPQKNCIMLNVITMLINMLDQIQWVSSDIT